MFYHIFPPQPWGNTWKSTPDPLGGPTPGLRTCKRCNKNEVLPIWLHWSVCLSISFKISSWFFSPSYFILLYVGCFSFVLLSVFSFLSVIVSVSQPISFRFSGVKKKRKKGCVLPKHSKSRRRDAFYFYLCAFFVRVSRVVSLPSLFTCLSFPTPPRQHQR